MAYTKDEYYLRQMQGMQNAAYNQQNALGNFMRAAQRNPLEGYDIRNCPMDELQLMIDMLVKEYDRRTRHTPMQGPTKAELEQNEALRNAWEAFEIVRKLQGEKK